MKSLKRPIAVGVVLAVAFAAGCAKKNPVELVGQRAAERWDLIGAQHIVKAYDYLSPGYRSTHTLEQYVAFIATAKVHWKSAKVDSVKCDGEVCTAKMLVTAMLPGAILHRDADMEYQSPVIEKWVLSDGQWYFLPDSKINAGHIAEEAAQAAHPAAPAAAAPAPPPHADAAAQGPQHQ